MYLNEESSRSGFDFERSHSRSNFEQKIKVFLICVSFQNKLSCRWHQDSFQIYKFNWFLAACFILLNLLYLILSIQHNALKIISNVCIQINQISEHIWTQRIDKNLSMQNFVKCIKSKNLHDLLAQFGINRYSLRFKNSQIGLALRPVQF